MMTTQRWHQTRLALSVLRCGLPPFGSRRSRGYILVVRPTREHSTAFAVKLDVKRQIALGFLGVLVALTQAYSQTPMPASVVSNSFFIHLQEGFNQHLEAIIEVDGKIIYRGTPETSRVLGLAEQIAAKATSRNPVVTFTMSSQQTKWSQKIDLSAGTALGISLQPNGVIKIRQAKAFAYD